MGITDAKQLKKHEFFHNLPDSIIDELAKEVEEIKLDSGDVLFEKGDPGDALFVIRSGWVKLVSEDAEGSEVVLNQIGPGNIIGEMAVVDQEPRSSGVVALSEVELLKLKSEAFINLVKRDSVMGIQVIRDLSVKLRFANTYLENAIEWSQKIASGDYSFAKEQMEQTQATIVVSQQGDDARANRFLATFFSMVEDIKQREGKLQKELDKLIIEIDSEKLHSDVKELSGTEFFRKLRKVRQNRRNKKSK